MCIIHTLSSVITKTLSPSKPRNDDKDGLSFTVRVSAFLKYESILEAFVFS